MMVSSKLLLTVAAILVLEPALQWSQGLRLTASKSGRFWRFGKKDKQQPLIPPTAATEDPMRPARENLWIHVHSGWLSQKAEYSKLERQWKKESKKKGSKPPKPSEPWAPSWEKKAKEISKKKPEDWQRTKEWLKHLCDNWDNEYKSSIVPTAAEDERWSALYDEIREYVLAEEVVKNAREWGY